MFLILCPLLFLVCFFSLWCFFWSCFTISTENVPGWSIPRVPDTLHLHNTDRKNIHWIQMYYTSTFSLPWTLSKVQAPIRTAFHIYTNKDSRDWNISFCLPIGLEWFIRYEEKNPVPSMEMKELLSPSRLLHCTCPAGTDENVRKHRRVEAFLLSRCARLENCEYREYRETPAGIFVLRSRCLHVPISVTRLAHSTRLNKVISRSRYDFFMIKVKINCCYHGNVIHATL